MKLLNDIKPAFWFTVISLLVGLSACEKYYTDDAVRNTDAKLCGKPWISEYIDGNNVIHTYQLSFDRTGSGAETIITQGEGYKNTNTTSFTWKWINDFEGLQITFPTREVIFFDNVWVRQYYLSGNYDGEEITFYSE